MKIRTDFVTNSSSSSFVLSLKFTLTNGNEITWEGVSDCGEGGYDYCCLSARKSPKELGECQTIDELVEMVKSSIGECFDEDFEDEETELGTIFDDDSSIIKELRCLSSMDDISEITIEGYEDTFHDYEDGPEAFDEIVTYDMKKKKMKAVGVGTTYIECEGHGGALNFKRKTTKKETPDGYFDKKREHPLFNQEYDEDEE